MDVVRLSDEKQLRRMGQGCDGIVSETKQKEEGKAASQMGGRDSKNSKDHLRENNTQQKSIASA